MKAVGSGIETNTKSSKKKIANITMEGSGGTATVNRDKSGKGQL